MFHIRLLLATITPVGNDFDIAFSHYRLHTTYYLRHTMHSLLRLFLQCISLTIHASLLAKCGCTSAVVFSLFSAGAQLWSVRRAHANHFSAFRPVCAHSLHLVVEPHNKSRAAKKADFDCCYTNNGAWLVLMWLAPITGLVAFSHASNLP